MGPKEGTKPGSAAVFGVSLWLPSTALPPRHASCQREHDKALWLNSRARDPIRELRRPCRWGLLSPGHIDFNVWLIPSLGSAKSNLCALSSVIVFPSVNGMGLLTTEPRLLLSLVPRRCGNHSLQSPFSGFPPTGRRAARLGVPKSGAHLLCFGFSRL